MTQTLTLAEVKLNGRKAYEAGLLTAQLPPEDAKCAYRVGDHRCVIGWSLFDETLAQVSVAGYNEVGLLTDQVAQFVVCEDVDETAIWRLQELHDAWASSVVTGNMNSANETNFKNALYAD